MSRRVSSVLRVVVAALYLCTRSVHINGSVFSCICLFFKKNCVIVFATLCVIVQMAVWSMHRCLWLTKVFPHSTVFVILSLFSVCLFLTLCLSLHAPVCVAGCAGPGRDSSHPLITRYSTQARGSLHCTLGPRNQNHTSLPNSRGAHNSCVGVFLPVCMLVSVYLCVCVLKTLQSKLYFTPE